MTALRETILSAPDVWLAGGGVIIGVFFGAVLVIANFCVMGAVSDWRLGGDKKRLGAAAIAAATAILGTQALDAAGITDLSKSIYLVPRLNWIGALGGGLIFGAGMVYAGGCPSRLLARAGGGDLRALIALLILAIAAFAMISGVFASLRVALQLGTATDLAALGLKTQSLPDVLAALGLPQPIAQISVTIASAALLFAFAKSAKTFSSSLYTFGGIAAGLLVTAGWALTGMAYDDMAANPINPASLSFVRPASEAIEWVERSSALGLPGFGAATVLGVLAGSLAAARLSKSNRIMGFADTADLKRHIGGALAMGIGGVLALGCSIGQGITGLSSLSVQSILACGAIIVGTMLGLARLEAKL